MTSNTINDGMTIAGGEGALLAGRYRIVRQLGQGGMGSVWFAEDMQLDEKPFAIKMLPSILVANRRAYRQLKAEALVAMRLVHPNIVQIRAFEENNGNPFLVMDYIDGQTLDDFLAERGTLGEEETVKLLEPIAAALDYAHGEGVVHRDVKPANVMVRKDGHPFILDFGIAREIQETMTRMTGKLSSGTLLYMSPEQLKGSQPKSAQDVYSFAAMVYECLKGDPPFSRGQIEYQIINVLPSPLASVAPQGGNGQSDDLAAGVMAGLAKDPEERPATCLAVLGGGITGEDPVAREENRDSQRIVCVAGEVPKAGNSYTQADCIRLMADAKVAQRHLARFLENPAYRQELREIEDDFVRADAILAEKQWTLAAECYARIIERGRAIEEADARRVAEEKARYEAGGDTIAEQKLHEVEAERIYNEELAKAKAERKQPEERAKADQKHRIEGGACRGGGELSEKFVFTSHAEFVVMGIVYVLIFAGVLFLAFGIGMNWDVDRIWNVIHLILRR